MNPSQIDKNTLKYIKLKYLATCNDVVLPENTDPETIIEYVDIGSVDRIKGIKNTEIFKFKDAPSRARRLVQSGDVIISTVRTYLESIAPISDQHSKSVVSTGFAVVRSTKMLSEFAKYALKSREFISSVIIESVGVGYPAISSRSLMNLKVSAPELTDQKDIAWFLDVEVGRIDSLVKEKQAFINLLKEKRQALISHVVTKGLDTNVEMKDSGVEWIGSTPENWSVAAIKRLTAVQRGASPRPIDDQVYFDENGEYAWTRIADVSKTNGDLKKTLQRLSSLGSSLSVKLEPGSLFLSIAGTVGKPCITKIKACIHDGFVYFPTLRRVRIRFLFYVFQSGEPYKGLGKMGTQLNLNTETVGSIKITFPTLEKQDEIVKYIDERTFKINKIISETEKSVELLREYRAALISAAVTGKIDLRDKEVA